jgi:hypothetical protein
MCYRIAVVVINISNEICPKGKEKEIKAYHQKYQGYTKECRKKRKEGQKDTRYTENN